MKLTRPSDVVALLERLRFRPSRILGQNFLIDGNILDILLRAADIGADDQILEVGPGLGIVTGPLLQRAARVVAIEKDDRLHAHLASTFSDQPHLDLIHADALAVDLNALLSSGVNKLVANLPYAIASRLLVELSESPCRPTRMVATVQQEVGERLTAGPGTKEIGVLSVLLQYRYDVRVVKTISERCFFPRPQIRSAIVQLDAHTRPGAKDHLAFKSLVKHAFSRRRKQLGSLLPSLPGICIGRDQAHDLLSGLDINPTARPETLAIADWIRLADAIFSNP